MYLFGDGAPRQVLSQALPSSIKEIVVVFIVSLFPALSVE